MSLRETGERGLIEELRRMFEKTGERTLLGIGDDAAVVDAGGRLLVITTDSFTEWHHFRWDFISPDQTGEKALNATVSDCAAMGCAPLWVTVSLAAPAETQTERIMEIFIGLKRGAERHRCDIVGGDTVASTSDLVLTLTAVGEPFGERVITRSGAGVGDDLFVTGRLGGPMAGLLLLRHEPSLSLEEEFRPSVMRFLAPEARVDAARILSRRFPVTSLIDVSDGLSVDLHHLARESGVGFHVEKANLPVESSIFAIAERLEVPPEVLALHGGEEFELLFTLPPGEEERVVRELREEAGLEVTRIGTAVPSEEGVLLVDENGEEEPLPEKGYEHFRERGPEK
ncbi:MAG: thiamine-phosphate kinase [Candidatus Eisenbacteria bacterium]